MKNLQTLGIEMEELRISIVKNEISQIIDIQFFNGNNEKIEGLGKEFLINFLGDCIAHSYFLDEIFTKSIKQAKEVRKEKGLLRLREITTIDEKQ
jgi:hypothetical protein